jgi:hypothetical protein
VGLLVLVLIVLVSGRSPFGPEERFPLAATAKLASDDEAPSAQDK